MNEQYLGNAYNDGERVGVCVHAGVCGVKGGSCGAQACVAKV